MSDPETVTVYPLAAEWWYGDHLTDGDKRLACQVQSHYFDLTLDCATWEPVPCACAGCWRARTGCPVCNCGHIDQQRESLRRAAHIAVKQMAGLLEKRREAK